MKLKAIDFNPLQNAQQFVSDLAFCLEISEIWPYRSRRHSNDTIEWQRNDIDIVGKVRHQKAPGMLNFPVNFCYKWQTFASLILDFGTWFWEREWGPHTMACNQHRQIDEAYVKLPNAKNTAYNSMPITIFGRKFNFVNFPLLNLYRGIWNARRSRQLSRFGLGIVFVEQWQWRAHV